MIACHTFGIMHNYEEGEVEHINGPTHATPMPIFPIHFNRYQKGQRYESKVAF